MKRRALLLLGNLLVFTLLFLGLEAFARFFLAHNNRLEERSAYNLDYAPSAYVRHLLRPGQQIFALAADGRVDYARRLYTLNGHGMRAEEFPEAKEPGELRVFFLGGSHVFDLNCYDYRDCPGFPAIAGRRLAGRLAGHRVRVINGGTAGQDSRAFASLIQLGLARFAPDLVVLDSAWNDLKWIHRLGANENPLAVAPGGGFNPLAGPQGGLDRLLGPSAVYRKLRDAFWARRLKLEEVAAEGRISPPAGGVDVPRAIAQYRQNLRGAVFLVRSLGALPVLAIEERLVAEGNDAAEQRQIAYPMIGVADHRQLVALFEACDKATRELAAELAVPLVDLNAAMQPRRRELFADHVHTTEAGSFFLGEAWAEQLLPLLAERAAQRP